MMWIVWIVGGSALADKSQDAEKHLFALASCHDGWHHQPVWASFLLPQPCLLPPPSRADGSADAREALSVAIFSSEAAALCRMDRLETPRPNVQVHRDDPSKFFLQVPLASGTIDAVDRRAISDLTLCTAKAQSRKKGTQRVLQIVGPRCEGVPEFGLTLTWLLIEKHGFRGTAPVRPPGFRDDLVGVLMGAVDYWQLKDQQAPRFDRWDVLDTSLADTTTPICNPVVLNWFALTGGMPLGADAEPTFSVDEPAYIPIPTSGPQEIPALSRVLRELELERIEAMG